MLLVISILIISGFLIIGLSLSSPRQQQRLWRRLPTIESEQIKRSRLRSRIAVLLSFSQIVIEKFRIEDSLRKNLNAAHIKLIPPEFFSVKLFFMAVLCLLSILALRLSQPAAIVLALAIGYVLPDLWLRKKIMGRKGEIARLLPETVDLLGLCIEAGLDFTTAVRWIIEKAHSNPMVEELSFVLEEIKWGKPRTQALRDMAKRLNITEVSSFVQTLVQAERMGTPVAEAFTILSEDTRERRFHRGERYALQAPIKILIPLIFCILPVIAIVIGGPIFLQFMQGGMLKGMIQ
jgi:tight adherence protein C